MNPLLMFWNIQKAAVKTFARFAMEISMVHLYVLLMKYQWFWNQQESAVNQATLPCHGFIYKTAVRIEIMVAVVGVVDMFYL